MTVRMAAFSIFYRSGPGDTYVLVQHDCRVPLSGRSDEHATVFEDALKKHAPIRNGDFIVQNNSSYSLRTFRVRTERTITES